MRNGWKSLPISKACKLFTDGNWVESKDQSPSGIRLVQTGNVGLGKFKDRRNKARFISEETFLRLKCQEVFAGDCLVSRLPDPVGRSCIIPETGNKMITAVDCTVIRFDLSVLTPSFFNYYSQSERYLADIEAYCSGATRKRISRKNLEKVQVPIPPLPEQKRIVAILDEAFAGIDAAVANTEKNLANARELFEASVTHRLFGDPDAKGWIASTVEEIALPKKGSIRTGPFGSQLLHSEFVDEGIAVLGIDNAVNNEFSWGKSRFITEEKYEALKRYTVKPGDVIITIMGTCGRCAIVPDDIPTAINTKHLCCITLDHDRCLPEFLHGYFLYHPVAREYLKKQAKGSIMAGLNMGIIKSLPVRLPDLDEQSRIAVEIDNLRNEAQRLEAIYQQKLTALAELKQSLLQKAFSGELTADKAAPDATLKDEACV